VAGQIVTLVHLNMLYPDGDLVITPLDAKGYADELIKNNLEPAYPLPVWKVDDECYLVLHYGKSFLAGYRQLLERGYQDIEVDVEIIEAETIERARSKAEPPPSARKSIRKKSEHRRPSPEELREFLESLPFPTSRSGYQAGIVHGLTYAVRGIEPTNPEWIDYTQDAVRNRRVHKKKQRR
jgi:hypothetical protein